MKIAKQHRMTWMAAGIMVSVFFFMLSGCAYFNKGDKGADDEGQGGNFAPPIYYDFGDVRIPEELEVDKDASFVYRTPGFSAGVLVLQGRVELYSLIAFFEKSMASDSWKFISSFKSPRTIMLFHKKDRWCIINITERKLSTLVEIWVAPTLEKPTAG